MSKNQEIKKKRFERPKIVTIGGGTGHFALLSGLKNHGVDLAAVVTMADDGGSTGVLRDELGVLPPGDLRQCLVALSEADELVRELFTHRFDTGTLKGHNFGNIFISALEQVSGSIEHAVEEAAGVLKIRGEVLPVTLDKTNLSATLKDDTVLNGEYVLSGSNEVFQKGVKSMELTPKAKLNPKVERAIRQADLVVLGPGNLYSSLIPNVLVPELGKVLQQSYAPTVFVANLMNKMGHTDDFDCARYVEEIEKYAGTSFIDVVLYNTQELPNKLLKRYKDQASPVECVMPEKVGNVEYVGADVISDVITEAKSGDPIVRTLIRHDSEKLARAVMQVLQDTM